MREAVSARLQKVAGIPLYPFLVALYPLLALLAENVQELRLATAYRSIILVLVSTGLLLLVLSVALRQADLPALIVSFAVILFFSYGHLYTTLKTVEMAGILLGRHRYLVPAFFLLMLLWAFLVAPRMTQISRINLVATVVALSLLVVPVFRISSYLIRRGLVWGRATAEWQAGRPVAQGEAPDIYYIILDAYTRSDVMLQRHGFNNHEFLHHLEDKGFYIADGSHANHNWTSLSLASSLNMAYAQDLGLKLVPNSYPSVLVEPIQHSRLRVELERLGYRTVGFRSGYLPTELEDADLFIGPGVEVASDRGGGVRFNRYEHLLLHSSAGLILLDWAGGRIYDWVGFRSAYPFEVMRRIILYQYESIPRVVDEPGPKFVFMHVVAPHGPFLFDAEGNPVVQSGVFTLQSQSLPEESPSKSVLYREQAIYITARTQEAIDVILEQSEEPPIIIIQADHGWSVGGGWNSPTGFRLWERTAILNAYHLPGQCADRLYPTITPVNTFRLILSCYFDLDYPLLEDQVFFSPNPRRSTFVFTPVTEFVRESAQRAGQAE